MQTFALRMPLRLKPMNILHRMLAALQPSMVATGSAHNERTGPYTDTSTNQLYDLLFCDSPAAYAPAQGRSQAPWQRLLYSTSPRPGEIRSLAEDRTQESRVRALAYDWLRRHGHDVPTRQLLGVVLEVPLERGLDVLAAYVDGSVRYLNHAAAPALFEGPMEPLQPHVTKLLSAAQAIVDRIGPTDQPRRPAPSENVRLNFLVSDGLYFGEGPMATLQRDSMAGPLLSAGAALLSEVVDLATRHHH